MNLSEQEDDSELDEEVEELGMGIIFMLLLFAKKINYDLFHWKKI